MGKFCIFISQEAYTLEFLDEDIARLLDHKHVFV